MAKSIDILIKLAYKFAMDPRLHDLGAWEKLKQEREQEALLPLSSSPSSSKKPKDVKVEPIKEEVEPSPQQKLIDLSKEFIDKVNLKIEAASRHFENFPNLLKQNILADFNKLMTLYKSSNRRYWLSKIAIEMDEPTKATIQKDEHQNKIENLKEIDFDFFMSHFNLSGVPESAFKSRKRSMMIYLEKYLSQFDSVQSPELEKIRHNLISKCQLYFDIQIYIIFKESTVSEEAFGKIIPMFETLPYESNETQIDRKVNFAVDSIKIIKDCNISNEVNAIIDSIIQDCESFGDIVKKAKV